jgi:hypothetical protein
MTTSLGKTCGGVLRLSRGYQVEFQLSIVTPQQGAVSYGELLRSGGRLAVMDALHLANGDVAVVLAVTVATEHDEARLISRLEDIGRRGCHRPRSSIGRQDLGHEVSC